MPRIHQSYRKLAFVDLETTGLGPSTMRIAEIGLVLLDEDGTREEWATLVNPGRFRRGWRVLEGIDYADLADAPRFEEIAAELAQRLDGRLLVAHNARFDYAFLKAEFERAGVAFESPALCTVMLSRKLFREHERHDLDAIVQRHGLSAEARHRALPDARLLCAFWQAMRRQVPSRVLWSRVGQLLAEPLLPPHLDPGLVEALPQKAGVYAMRGKHGEALRIARAANLRREAKAYFRLDRISVKAAKIACAVRNIEWQACEGELAARLLEIRWKEKEAPARTTGRYPPGQSCSIRMDPSSKTQVAEVVPAACLVAQSRGLYGLYGSDRKARNALLKMAGRHRLCHRSLGLVESACRVCAGEHEGCARARAQNLVRVVSAVSATRLQPWPYYGPVGVREGRTVHVFDQWQHLGSAKTAGEIAELAQQRPTGFNPEVFGLLSRVLPRLGPRRLKTLRRSPPAADDPGRAV